MSGRLLFFASILLLIATATHGANIIILGPELVRLQGGMEYSDAAVCNNQITPTTKLPQCAYVDTKTDGSGVLISGIPRNCDTVTTGKCTITATSPNATCFTKADCRGFMLVVDGKPFPNKFPGAIAYNMGRYTIKYSSTTPPDTCRYSNGTAWPSCSRTLIVEDKEAPEITLLGSSFVVLEGGQTFVDDGAIGHDLVDGDMLYNKSAGPCKTETINGVVNFIGEPGNICRVVEGGSGLDLDNKNINNQTINYVAVDTTGNKNVVKRTVILEDKIAPNIELCGPQIIRDFEAGNQYIDSYCTPKVNPCDLLVNDKGVKCLANTLCDWDVVDEVCYLKNHTCFFLRTETACVANANCKYCPKGVIAADIVDGDITAKVFVDNPVDILPDAKNGRPMPARYTIYYNVADAHNNKALRKSRVVIVDDKTPPSLTLLGVAEEEVEGATTFVEPFARAFDLLDGDVTDRITLEVDRLSLRPPNNCFKKTGCDSVNRVDPMAPAGASFLLTYRVTDSKGNPNITSRLVKIVDRRKPTLQLLGLNPMFVEGATFYNESGALAFDTLDDADTLTAKIIISGDRVNVNSDAFTSFNLSYNVKDDAGNPADPLFRLVVIADTLKPNITLNGLPQNFHQANTNYEDKNVTGYDTLDKGYLYLPRFTSRIRKLVTQRPIVCKDNEFEASPTTLYISKICKPISTCKSDEFESKPPSKTSDRICTKLTPPCILGSEYQLRAPTNTSDRVCQECVSKSPLGTPIATPRDPYCFTSSPPTVTHRVVWSNATLSSSSIEIFEGDTVIWTFNPSLYAVVSTIKGAGSFSSLNLINQTNPQKLPTFDFRVIFPTAGRYEYSSPGVPAMVASINVVKSRILNSCSLPSTLAPATLSALKVIFSNLEARARRTLLMTLPSIREDSLGLCQHVTIQALNDVLQAHIVESNGISSIGKIAIVNAPSINGRFQITNNNGATWSNVPTVSQISPLILEVNGTANRIRFLSNAHFYGSVNLTFTVVTKEPQTLSDFIAIASLAILPVNDAPILVDGANFIDMDEDPPITQLSGTPVINLVRNYVTDPDSLTDKVVSYGVAVVGVDNRYGQWQWSCGAKGDLSAFVPFVGGIRADGTFISTPTPDLATLLLSTCFIRFVPKPNFNTDFDDHGNRRPATDIPTLQYRAWDSTGNTTGKNGKDGVDTTRDPGQFDSEFSSRIATSSIIIYFSEDAPMVFSSGDILDYDVSFREGQRNPVLIVDQNFVTIDYHDGDFISEVSVQLTNGLDGVAESISFDTSGTDLNVVVTQNPFTLFIRPKSSLRLPKSDFISVLKRLRYFNSNSEPNPTQRVIIFRARDGTRTGERTATTITYKMSNDPPIVDLDPTINDVDAFLQYPSTGGALKLCPQASVIEPDGDRIKSITVKILNFQKYEGLSVELGSANSKKFTATFDDQLGVLVIKQIEGGPLASPFDFRTVLRTLTYEFPVMPTATTSTSASTTTAATTIGSSTNPGNTTTTRTTTTTTIRTTTTTTTRPSQLNIPREIVVLTSDGILNGISSIHLSTQNVNSPPWIDTSGADVGLIYNTTFVEGDGSVSVVGPRMFIFDMDDRTLKSATVQLLNPTDCAYESLTWSDAIAQSLGLSISWSPSTSLLAISGDSALENYEQLISSIRYANSNTEPSLTTRVIEFYVNDGKTKSLPAYTNIIIEEANDAPVIVPNAGVSSLNVAQDADDYKNIGWSIPQILAPRPPLRETKARYTVSQCAGGCTWKGARDSCIAVNKQLCTRKEISDIWPNGRDSSRFGWTNDAAPTAPKVASLSTLSQRAFGVNISDDSAMQTSFAWMMYSHAGAEEPIFMPALVTDDHVGLPLDAICCDSGEGVRAQAVFNHEGVTGTIVFTQTSILHATRIRFDLKGLPRTGAKFMIHELDTPFAGSRLSICDGVGELFNPAKLTYNQCSSASPNLCPLGDLSARFGNFSDGEKYTDILFEDKNVPLFGPNSVVGRSMVIYKDGRPWICTNIRYTSSVITAYATLAAPINGYIQFTQLANDPASPTSVSVHLNFDSKLRRQTSYWYVARRNVSAPSVCSDNSPLFTGGSNQPFLPNCTYDNLLATCSIGDLTKKFGEVKLPSNDGQMFVDLNLPLSGPNSILGQNVIINMTDGTNTCSEINVETPQPISVRAVFDINGISGVITFSQTSPSSPTTIAVDIQGQDRTSEVNLVGAKYFVTNLPTEQRSVEDIAPSCDGLGEIFNPRVTSGACTSDKTTCFLGDLSGKNGVFPQAPFLFTAVDQDLPLSGLNSIVGRGLLIKTSGGSNLACATIGYPAEVTTAVARFFKSPVVGRVVFRQVSGKPGSQTSVHVELRRSDGKDSSTGHSWSVHQNSVTCFCENSGAVFNPSNRTIPCATRDQCAIGDLRGKFGSLSLPGKSASRTRSFFIDNKLPLSGSDSIIGKSLVIFDDQGNRIACTNIEVLQPRTVRAVFDQEGVYGSVQFQQSFIDESAALEVNLEGLESLAGDYSVSELPVSLTPNSEGALENNCISVGDIYNPFSVTRSCDNRVFLSTSEQCRLGDLSGKHGDIDRVPFAARVHQDTRVSLYGSLSVSGRSIAIKKRLGKVENWVCATLQPTAPLKRLEAKFTGGTISGSISFSQDAESSLSETSVFASLTFTDNNNMTASQNVDWMILDIGSCNPNDTNSAKTFNPYQVSINDTGYASDCGTGRRQLRCAAGDMRRKHGQLRIPAAYNGQFFTDMVLPLSGKDNIENRVIMITATVANTTRTSCAIIRRTDVSVMNDEDSLDDPNAKQGIAIVSVNNEHGSWQRRVGSGSDWMSIDPNTVNVQNAIVLRSIDDNRVRFVPELNYLGSEQCAECPIPRAKSCIPCPLNRTAGSITFALWDTTNSLVDGSFGDATYNSASGSFSQYTKTIQVLIQPQEVNETAPIGTTFDIVFDVRDNVSNAADSVRREVTVIDTIKPEIFLRGNSSIVHEASTPYVDAGATAFDTHSLDLTPRLAVMSIKANLPAYPTPPSAELLLTCSSTGQRISGFPSSQPYAVGRILTCNTNKATLATCVITDQPNTFDNSTMPWNKTAVVPTYITPVCATVNTTFNCYAKSRLLLKYPDGITDFKLLCDIPVSETQCLFFDYSLRTQHNPAVQDVVDVFVPSDSKYTITYHVSDASGNNNTISRTITIKDRTPPVVSPATGRVTLEYHTANIPYSDHPQRLTGNCPPVQSHVPHDKLTLFGCVSATDSLNGNLACGVTATVHQLKPSSTIASILRSIPTQNLNGLLVKTVNSSCLALSSNPSIVECAEKTGSLSTLSTAVPLSTNFIITYSVKDFAGNSASTQRLVTVVDTTPPVITIAPEFQTFTIPYGGIYTNDQAKMGVTAFDILDGNLTSKITFKNPVNSVLRGAYKIEYNVTDKQGNIASTVFKTVFVEEEKYTTLSGNSYITVRAVLKNMDETLFNVKEEHNNFRRNLILTLKNMKNVNTTWLNETNIVQLRVDPIISNRRSDDRPDSLLTYLIQTPCAESATISSALFNITKDGRLIANLASTSPDTYDGVQSIITDRPAADNRLCPAASTASSTATRDGLIGAFVAFTLIVFVVVLLLWMRRRRNAKIFEDKASLVSLLNYSTAAATLPRGNQGQAVNAGGFNIPMQAYNVPMEDVTMTGSDTMKRLKIGGVRETRLNNNNNNNNNNNVEREDTYDNAALLKKKMPVLAPKENFTESDDGLYESGDAVKKEGFNAHDRSARSNELQEIYEDANGMSSQPPPPPSKYKPAPSIPIQTNLEEFKESEDGIYEAGDNVKREGFATHDRTERSAELQEIYEDAAVKTRTLTKKTPVLPMVSLQPSTAFQETEEGIYETGETRFGFSAHDKTDRSEELQELYEDMKAPSSRPPDVPQKKKDPPPPPVLSLQEDGEFYNSLPSHPTPQEDGELYNSLPSHPAPVLMTPSTFTETEEGFYETGPVTKRAGFTAHDQSARSEELQEIYEDARGRSDMISKTATLTKMPPPPPPVDDQEMYTTMSSAMETLPPPPPNNFFESEEGLYESGPTSVRAGFTSHDRSERSAELQAIQDEVYEVTHTKGSNGPPPPVVPAKTSTLPPRISLSNTAYNMTPNEPVMPFDHSATYSSMDDQSGGIYEGVEDHPIAPPKSLTSRPAPSIPGQSDTLPKPSRNVSNSQLTPWLHGELNRKEADAILTNHGIKDGLFLVRSKGDGFVLSMCIKGRTEHHNISKDDNGLFQINGKPLVSACPTLASVIRHLQRNVDQTSTLLTEGVPCM